jgi:hypothetical protein
MSTKDRILQLRIDEARAAAAGDNADLEEATRCALIAEVVFRHCGKLYDVKEIRAVLDAAGQAKGLLEEAQAPKTYAEFEPMQAAILTGEGGPQQKDPPPTNYAGPLSRGEEKKEK